MIPQNAAFLWVHPKHQDETKPLVTSHTVYAAHFRDRFYPPMTKDRICHILVKDAIEFYEELGGLVSKTLVAIRVPDGNFICDYIKILSCYYLCIHLARIIHLIPSHTCSVKWKCLYVSSLVKCFISHVSQCISLSVCVEKLLMKSWYLVSWCLMPKCCEFEHMNLKLVISFIQYTSPQPSPPVTPTTPGTTYSIDLLSNNVRNLLRHSWHWIFSSEIKFAF